MNTKRSCGVLLPLFSLPSEHGIGTLGMAAAASWACRERRFAVQQLFKLCRQCVFY